MQDKEIWAYKAYENGSVMALMSPANQVMSNKGSIRSWQKFEAFVKFPNENHITNVFEHDENMPDPFHAFDKQMRSWFKWLVEKECPKFEELIDKNKYKTEDFFKMLDDYEKACK